MKINHLFENTQPTLFIPIGPSGSGKSTLYQKLKAQNPDMQVFSLDLLRHEWYDAKDYAAAWKASTEDKEFANKANQRFMEMVSTKKDVFVDNTNLTLKRRRFYLDQARRQGYKTVAYLLPTDLDTLVARQGTRKDKNVPADAVRQQFTSLQPPTSGEFDEVITIDDKNAQPKPVA